MVGICRSPWSCLFETNHGALVVIPKNLFCITCILFIWLGAAHSHIEAAYVIVGRTTDVYKVFLSLSQDCYWPGLDVVFLMLWSLFFKWRWCGCFVLTFDRILSPSIWHFPFRVFLSHHWLLNLHGLCCAQLVFSCDLTRFSFFSAIPWVCQCCFRV